MVLLAAELGKWVIRGKPYTLHPKATTVIHHLEEILVRLGPEEIQAGNLEVGPEMAHVVLLALHSFGVDLGELVGVRLGAQDLLGKTRLGGFGLLLGLGLDKHLPQTLRGNVVEALVSGGVAEDVGDGLAQFLDRDGEAVGLVVLDHLEEGVTGGGTMLVGCAQMESEEWKDVLGDVAEVLDLGLQAPVPLVLLEELVLVEETVLC